jgi:hypothetical protein
LESEDQNYADPATVELHSIRERTVREELAGRLREVCAHFTEEEFTRLVDQMAERKVREERRPVW